MAVHQIVAVAISPLRSRQHETVSGVVTRHGSSDIDTHWSLAAVLRAMNGSQQFVTHAANGRQARVQRYTCSQCRAEHIRTHILDRAIEGALLQEMPRIATSRAEVRSAAEGVLRDLDLHGGGAASSSANVPA
jgi:hypothetical protein